VIKHIVDSTTYIGYHKRENVQTVEFYFRLKVLHSSLSKEKTNHGLEVENIFLMESSYSTKELMKERAA